MPPCFYSGGRLPAAAAAPPATRRSRLLPTVLAALLLVCVAASPVTLASALSAWVSGRADAWSYASATAGITTATLQDAFAADVKAAVQPLAGGGAAPTVAVTSFTVQSSATPAIGVVVVYTVAGAGTATDAEITAAVQASPLTSLNAAMEPVFKGGKARVLASIGPAGTAPTQAMGEMVGISGPSYGWQLTDNALGDPLPETLLAPLSFDVQNAIDSAGLSYVVAVNDMPLNASGQYLTFSVYTLPWPVTTLTPAEMVSRYYSGELPLFAAAMNAAMSAAPALDSVADFLPKDPKPQRHLYPSPDTTVAGIRIVDRYDTVLNLLFNGTAEGWESAVSPATRAAALNDAITTSLAAALRRGGFVYVMEVQDVHTIARGNSVYAGLFAQVRVTEGVQEGSQHPYDSSEMASVANNEADFSAVTAMYDDGSASPPPQLIATSVDGEHGAQCHGPCIVVVVVSSVAVFILLVIIILFLIIICCCRSCGDGSEEEEEARRRALNDDDDDEAVEELEKGEKPLTKYNSAEEKAARKDSAVEGAADEQNSDKNPLSPFSSREAGDGSNRGSTEDAVAAANPLSAVERGDYSSRADPIHQREMVNGADKGPVMAQYGFLHDTSSSNDGDSYHNSHYKDGSSASRQRARYPSKCNAPGYSRQLSARRIDGELNPFIPDHVPSTYHEESNTLGYIAEPPGPTHAW